MITESTREKMKQAQLRKPNRYWLGKKRPPFSKEWRENMSKVKKENPTRFWLGKKREPFSIETRNKMSDWKCKINNKDCEGQLEAHHILPWRDHPELRYETNNGITLCHRHHPRKRKEEISFSTFFQELIK